MEWVFGLGNPGPKKPRQQRWHLIYKDTDRGFCGSVVTPIRGTGLDVLESGVWLCGLCSRSMFGHPAKQIVKCIPDDCEVVAGDELDVGDVLAWYGRRLKIEGRRIYRYANTAPRGKNNPHKYRKLEFTSSGWPGPIRLYEDQTVMRERREVVVDDNRGIRLVG